MTKFLDAGIKNVIFGRGVTVINPCNLYGCMLGDGVFIGPFSEIQERVEIGAGTRIQSHSFICSDTKIGENCFIAHGVIFANDKFYGGKLAKKNSWGKIFIGNGVLIGSGALILPVRIAEGVVIGAGAVVTKDIMLPGIYAGNPARLLKKSKGDL